MKKQICLILGILTIISFNCDPKKILQEENPPEAGNIESDDVDGDFIFEPGTTHKFWIRASDPEGELLQYNWQVIGGELIGRTDTDTVLWQLSSIGGDSYRIEVKVENKHGEITRSRTVTVLSYEKPIVTITTPQEDDYIVQHSKTDVKANAFHELGISLVHFYINDSLISRQQGNAEGKFSFTWDVTQDSLLAEIKVLAISKTTAITGSDSITVNIEGFILGKPADD
jgi:hypothetical protein